MLCDRPGQHRDDHCDPKLQWNGLHLCPCKPRYNPLVPGRSGATHGVLIGCQRLTMSLIHVYVVHGAGAGLVPFVEPVLDQHVGSGAFPPSLSASFRMAPQ